MPNHAQSSGGSAGHPRTSYRESREAELKIFARRLWRLMVGKGWNQSELSRQSGVGRDMISGYVRAKHLPDPPHAKKLAAALGVEIEDLFPVSAGPGSATVEQRKELPEVEMRTIGDGLVMLHVNQKMSAETALQILALLAKPAA